MSLMVKDDSGQHRRFFHNGKNYKRIAKFKREEAAEAFVEKLRKESGSARFEPYIERLRWNLSKGRGLGRLSKLGFTRYRVYVPIMEK
jgi:hypothetical protein